MLERADRARVDHYPPRSVLFEQVVQRFVMRSIEPLCVADFDPQLRLRRPGVKEAAQISNHPGRVARRELEKHGTQAAAELLHDPQKLQSLGDVLTDCAGVADRFRELGAKLEIGGRLFHPAGDCIGSRDGVESGIAFHRVQPPGIFPQESRTTLSLWGKSCRPTP